MESCGTIFDLYLSFFCHLKLFNWQLFIDLGPTGFDRIRGNVCKHAGS